MYPGDLKYTKDHEWIKRDGTVGVTEYAQKELGDVVFVELPKAGKVLEARGQLGILESVKAVSNVYSPVAGKVLKVNDALLKNPELVNQEPFGKGWLAVLEIKDLKQLDGLMTAGKYQSYLNELHT